MKTWEPTKRQSEFLGLPDEVFEGMFGGAAGGGKSETLLMLPIARQFYLHPRFKGLLLRRTSPELERELIVRSQVEGYYKGTGASYNDQKKRWNFPGGGMVQFGHVEHDKSVSIYDSAEYNYIGWDECTSFTPYQYEYISFSRCRTSADNLPAFVRSGTNPGGVSHSYFRKRFVEPCPAGNKIIKEIRRFNGKDIETLLAFIPSKVSDNPHLLLADPQYIDRLYKLPEADRYAKAEGDWWKFEGQVFDDFREIRIPSEPENACHVVEPFEIPYYWPRVLSIDWGYIAMIHAAWHAINPSPNTKYPGKIYTYREYRAKKEKISTWATNLRRISEGEELADVVIDPSAFGRRGDEFTIAEQFAQHFGRQARPADNDRIGGKLLIQELLRWKARPPRYKPKEGYDSDLALRIRRMRGEKALEEYMNLFRPDKTEEFLPKWLIFNTCEEIIKVIPLCVYDSDDKEDVAEFSGDDPYDNVRYGLKACQFYLDRGKEEQQQEADLARICSLVEQGGSLTQYNINMVNLMARQRRAAMPMRRFHRGRFKGSRIV